MISTNLWGSAKTENCDSLLAMTIGITKFCCFVAGQKENLAISPQLW